MGTCLPESVGVVSVADELTDDEPDRDAQEHPCDQRDEEGVECVHGVSARSLWNSTPRLVGQASGSMELGESNYALSGALGFEYEG